MTALENPEKHGPLDEPPRLEYDPPEVLELGTLEQLTGGRLTPGLRDTLGGSLPG